VLQVRPLKNGRTLGLVAAMLTGALFPALHAAQFLVRPGCMLLLFLAFLGLPAGLPHLHASQLRILVASWLLALLGCAGLWFFSHDLALIALLLVLTPTATASPVVTALLGGRAEYPATMVLLTSLVQPPLVVLAVARLGASHGHADLLPMMGSTLLTILGPWILARLLLRGLPERGRTELLRLRSLSFWLWLVVLAVAMAGASEFLHRGLEPWWVVGTIGLLSLAVCALNFGIGRRLGGTLHPLEAGQAMGQKNTTFSLWFALTYLSPLVALGPASYILWHNLWNAWQLRGAGGGEEE